MTLSLLDHCTFTGPALPEPFVRHDLEAELTRRSLLPRTTGRDGQQLAAEWDVVRRKIRGLAARGGAARVRNLVLEPLVERLGYARIEQAPDVATREGHERGGHILSTPSGDAHLRVWSTDFDDDLDAPARRGAAYRYSHARIAQRVLLASGERIGLLTNGVELRILISDPARPDSQVTIPLDPHWKRSREAPDSYRLLLALASPAGVQALPEIVDKARLQQTRVTKELRRQAREAIEGFVQEVLDHPENRDAVVARMQSDRDRFARDLWHEGLVTVYRLLFLLKLEATDDPARAFGFASTSLWRNSFSPSVALGPVARQVLDDGSETGRMLEDGLRVLFRMFASGLESSELHIRPLGGSLFGEPATPTLSSMRWGERAVAILLDRLLWTPRRRGAEARERVHYGPLDVEDLGRVYEALLELEPGIADRPMCRLRRQKLEVVVPAAQGERYRPATATAPPDPADEDAEADSPDDDAEAEDDTSRSRGARVEWIEEIAPGRFYLRVGLGRKASGSYYTPHSFVRFLVQETLGPHVAQRSPAADPRPAEILKLKVLDPAMGSGHFLVEACRFLGERLYEACRLCDERALEAERRAEAARGDSTREAALREARDYRARVTDLPDPDDELVRYLPSRSPEGEETGLSQRKAEAMCRRLVAVHCLYGVDRNPLAVELAKLSLWLESHAEGLPLTFLDHRLVLGDSLTGPFFESLLRYPGTQQPMEDLFTEGLRESLRAALTDALRHVRDLEASVGVSLAETEAKRAAKERLDRALEPFMIIAAAWTGGVMLGSQACDDDGYADLARGAGSEAPEPEGRPRLLRMAAQGLGVDASGADSLADLLSRQPRIPALSYDLTFPEVFFPGGWIDARGGFDAVLGNPPWDRMLPADKEFFASIDFRIMGAPTQRERSRVQERLLADPIIRDAHSAYREGFRQAERITDVLYKHQAAVIDGRTTIGKQDLFRLFMERGVRLVSTKGLIGILVPSAFHANEGATGVRKLYIEHLGMRCCFSFENRRQLFEIHRSFKYALIVSGPPGPTIEFPCAFYLHDDEWLFGDRGDRELRFSLDLVRRTGGEYLSLLELRSARDLEVAEICFANGEPFGEVCERLGIKLGRELNMTDDAWRFTPTADVLPGGEDPRDPDVATRLLDMGYLVLHEGKTFRQYDDHWENRPRYVVALAQLTDKPGWLSAARYYRLAYRNIAGPGDENVSIWNLHPAGVATGEKGPTEATPESRPNSQALVMLAVLNSSCADWVLQLRVRATVSQFMLHATPVPRDVVRRPCAPFLVHTALQLNANHGGYSRIWSEQMSRPFAPPVLADASSRPGARAAIDAVVAEAYGLSRQQYEHVLASFSHRTYPQMPELCLARFDELKAIGIDAFTKKHDPYWDVPLNEDLPEPVIDIPLPERAPEGTEEPDQTTLDLGSTAARAADRPRSGYAAPSDTRTDGFDAGTYDRIREHLAATGVLTSADVQTLTGLTAAAVRPYLQRLVSDGLAVQEGRRRGARYSSVERP